MRCAAFLLSAIPALLAQTPVVPPDGGVFRVGGGVSAPSVLYKVDPVYTEEARKAKLSGTVLLSLIVGPDGAARDIRVARPLGMGLDKKAVQAVAQWKFKPGQKNGGPVAVQATIEVNFQLLVDADPGPPPASAGEAYRRGLYLIRTRNMAAGVALLNRAVELDPGWAAPLAARASAHVQQRAYAQAIDDYSAAIQLNSKHAAWFEGRGSAYENTGALATAKEDFSRAIEMNPDGPPVFYLARARVLSAMGDLAGAARDLSTAIQISPDNALLFQNRGDVYAKQQDWRRAIEDYTAAIELQPSRLYYEKRAEAKKNAGDAAGSEDDLKKAAAGGEVQIPASVAGAGALVVLKTSDPVDPSLVAPKLVAPNEGAVFDHFPRALTLNWEPSPGAVSYIAEWDHGYDGGWDAEMQKKPGIGRRVSGTSTTIDFAGAQPGRWRVWPVNAMGQRGAASGWRTFSFRR